MHTDRPSRSSSPPHKQKQWLSSQSQNTCPVCKAGVTKENVIPLYGRGTEAVDPRCVRHKT